MASFHRCHSKVGKHDHDYPKGCIQFSLSGILTKKQSAQFLSFQALHQLNDQNMTLVII